MMSRLAGLLVLILANASIFSLAETKIGSWLYYILLFLISAFFVYCFGSIEILKKRIEVLEVGKLDR